MTASQVYTNAIVNYELDANFLHSKIKSKGITLWIEEVQDAELLRQIFDIVGQAVRVCFKNQLVNK